MKKDTNKAGNLRLLQSYYPYPKVKPRIAESSEGWFKEENAEVLGQFLSGKTKVVLELGSWIGDSVRYLAERAPNSTVIAVDHWLGSYEHIVVDRWRKRLPRLYDSFIRNCWDHRKRVIPVRADTVTALRVVHSCGIAPDLIYIDGSHDYTSVIRDLDLSVRYFPSSLIVGDDWSWPGVQIAVTEHVSNQLKKWNRVAVKRVGNCWWLEQEGKLERSFDIES